MRGIGSQQHRRKFSILSASRRWLGSCSVRVPEELDPVMTVATPGSSRILVVDDEPFIVQLIFDMLSDEGYVVDTAANGRLALEQIRQRPYDLILSDLRMPDLDGLALYRELEQSWPELLCRIVFVSGTIEQPEYRSFLQDTGVPVLPKPFDLDQLREVTARHLAAGCSTARA